MFTFFFFWESIPWNRKTFKSDSWLSNESKFPGISKHVPSWLHPFEQNRFYSKPVSSKPGSTSAFNTCTVQNTSFYEFKITKKNTTIIILRYYVILSLIILCWAAKCKSRSSDIGQSKFIQVKPKPRCGQMYGHHFYPKNKNKQTKKTEIYFSNVRSRTFVSFRKGACIYVGFYFFL